MLRSKRIYLNKVTEDDVELYHSWRKDVEVMKTTSPYIDRYTLEETRKKFIKIKAEKFRLKGDWG